MWSAWRRADSGSSGRLVESVGAAPSGSQLDPLARQSSAAMLAIFEVGLPAAFLGAVLGLVIGSLVYVHHHVRDN